MITIDFKQGIRPHRHEGKGKIIKLDFRRGVFLGVEEAEPATSGNNYAAFYTLLKKMPYIDKESIIYEASGGRTTSLREFARGNSEGYKELIDSMRRIIGEEGSEATNPKEEAEKRRYRSLILKKLADRDIVVKNWDYTEVNNILAQWTRSDKNLKTMTLEELKKTNRQVSKIMDWYEKKERRLQ